jgi:hypothetical protein
MTLLERRTVSPGLRGVVRPPTPAELAPPPTTGSVA